MQNKIVLTENLLKKQVQGHVRVGMIFLGIISSMLLSYAILFIFFCNIPAMLVMMILAGIFGYFFADRVKKLTASDSSFSKKNYKLIEDEVYDKNTVYEGAGDESATSYIYTKMNGKMHVGDDIWKSVKKDSRVYILFVNNKENIVLVAENYILSPEVSNHVISYNVENGERLFNDKIIKAIEAAKKKGKVKCRNCKKTYDTNKNTNCPGCGAVYSYSIIDAVYSKEWYNS